MLGEHTLAGSQPPSMPPQPSMNFVESYSFAIVQCFVVYYGVAALLHFLVPAVMHTRSLQGKQQGKQTLRDALRSVPSLLVKAFTLVVGEWLHRNGYGCLTNDSLLKVMWDVRRVAMLGFMIVLLDLFHDTWFYFTHRWLHTPWMLRKVHYMHHQSHVPSAFTGYSFHWIEAFMVFSVAIAECFIFPIPFQLQRAYELYMVVIHIGGHCGYEMAPFVPHLVQVVGALSLPVLQVFGYFKGSQLTQFINNVEHHDMHHKYVRYHFSLYYTHWDSICGTMHPEYVQRHQVSS